MSPTTFLPLGIIVTLVLVLAIFSHHGVAAASDEVHAILSKPPVMNPAAENIPILMMHGIGSSKNDFKTMHRLFKEHMPHILTIPLDVNNDFESYYNLPLQLVKMQKLIVQLQKEHQFQKFHLICHSQGALLCRTLGAAWDKHEIQKMVLLSGPLLGQYGVPDARFLPEALRHITTDEAYLILYRKLAQETFSVANMWRDPVNYEQYVVMNQFLTRLYNESAIPADIERSHRFRENMLRVNHVYMFGSTADEVIMPYQSALLGYWDPEDPKRMLSMEEQKFFQHDECGFRTLQKESRLTQTLLHGVKHVGWILDDDIIIDHIMPIFGAHDKKQ